MRNLVFLITLRCPLECRHCIVDSSPRRTESLPTDVILRLIDEAAEVGVRTVGFTGGEPFIRPADLASFTQRAHSHGLRVIVITSAFFATTEERAFKILEPLGPLAMLGVSADIYHQQFTRIGNVRNVIRAAKRLRIDRIEIQAAFVDATDVNDVQDQLAEDAAGVVVRGQAVWPVGRAAGLVETNGSALKPIEMLDLQCPMVGPVIMPDGSVHGCCSSLLNLKDKNPLRISDITAISLREAMEQVDSDDYYQFLKSFGLRPILSLLDQAHVARPRNKTYTDVCHLCHELHANQVTKNVILQNFRKRDETHPSLE